MNICELCTCAENQICALCKILIIVGVAVSCLVIGYFVGKRKKKG